MLATKVNPRYITNNLIWGTEKIFMAKTENNT